MRSSQDSLLFVDNVSRITFLRVCIIAFILRLILFIYIAPYSPIKYYVNPDANNYENIALNLVNHSVFSNELHPPYTPDVRRTPGYPLFLASVYALSESSRAVAVLCQILLGSLTVGLTYLFARALLFSHQIALFSALLLAVDPLTIMYTNMLMTETLFTFLLVAGSLSLLGYFRTQRLSWLILAALIYAVAALTRPIGQFLPFVLLPLFAFTANSHLRWASLLRGLLFVSVSVALLFVWIFRNHSIAGIWSISNIGEHVLADYSARAVLETAEDLSEEEANSKIDEMIKTLGDPESLSLTETATHEREVAMRIFRQYPLATIVVYLDGMIGLLVNPGLDNICAQLSRAADVEGCQAAKAKVNANLLEKARSKFGDMDNVQLTFAIWSALFPLAIYALSAIGVYALIRNRQWFELLNLAIIITYLLLLSAGGQTTSRFRVPTMPYWSVLAAVGLALIKDRFAWTGRVTFAE